MTTASSPSTALARAQSGGLTTFAQGANPFINRPKEEGVSDGAYLRMNGKTGEFVGANDVKVDPNTQLVFDLLNCIEAWQGFDNDSKLVKGPEVSFKEGKKLKDPEQIPGVKWTKIFRIQVRMLDGSPALTYTAKADKPTREIWKLIRRYGEQMSRNRDETGAYMLPIVEISSRPYEFKAKEKKVVKNPVTGVEEIVEVEQPAKVFFESFPIVGWISQREIDEIVEAAAEAAEAEGAVEGAVEVVDEGHAPAQVTQQAPAPEVVVQAEKPTVATMQQPTTGTLKPAGTSAPTGAGVPGGPARRFTTGRVGGRV